MSDSQDELLTLLRLSPVGLPPYSVRGLTQTLEHIAAVQQTRRTVNGALLDLAAPQFRKYHSTISCTDQSPPPFGGLWPGMALQVDCVAKLSYQVGSPERTAVPGSEKNEEGFHFYRPRLQMRVISFTINEDEWGASIGWSLDLEEI